MNGSKQPILVIGATGKQGGATVRHLLKQGRAVRALVRDPTNPAALSLRTVGAELAQGDIDDEGSLRSAMLGVAGVFAVQPGEPFPVAQTDALEVRRGKLAIDAAKSTGVEHFVYASVIGADRHAAFRKGHKLDIETHLIESGLTWTILRPATFMENFTLPMLGLQTGFLVRPGDPDAEVSLIATDDIGAFAALAFTRRDQFSGRTLELAGDLLTPGKMADALAHALGRPIMYRELPMEDLRAHNAILGALMDGLNRTGSAEADIVALRALYPALQTFDAWLARGGAAKISALFDQAIAQS
jgi:uncharacterized protein YbjT (DUF2867 family)